MPLEELHVLRARPCLVLEREHEHLVGHVESVGFAIRPHAPRGEQYVNAASGAQIQHHLAFAQFGERGGIATSQRGQEGFGGQARGLIGFVQVGRYGVATRRAGAAAAARPFRRAAAGGIAGGVACHSLRHGAISGAHGLADSIVLHGTQWGCDLAALIPHRDIPALT